jgi:hypothetical protein
VRGINERRATLTAVVLQLAHDIGIRAQLAFIALLEFEPARASCATRRHKG